ncbi:VanZ family protein [Sporolactobacillus shoreae]|uniref:VanZ family protein n=1 Tax=Sporolactobacillus shoreae TaxID=1465501 RepID=A0A4Z0GIQ1_9BACL|nr:VanZ family protein [Sporolactobacillus shoreae]TGA96666.1 VanZ family protein [Sporolactobacillus shoreae]
MEHHNQVKPWVKNALISSIISVCIALFYIAGCVGELFDYYIKLELIVIGCHLIVFTIVFIFITRKITLKGKMDGVMFFAFQAYSWIAFYLLLALDPFSILDRRFGPNVMLMVNLVPLNTIIDQFSHYPSADYALKQIFGNIIVLAPLCFFLLYFRRIRVRHAFLVLFLYSLSIEFLQFLSDLFLWQRRAADIDDVILNTLGAAVGIAAYYLFIAITHHLSLLKNRFKKDGAKQHF